MNYTFSSFNEMSDPRNSGRILLEALVKVAPEVFGEAHNYMRTGRSAKRTKEGVTFHTHTNEISGLFVLRETTTVVTVIVLKDMNVDRIYTLPRFRKQGHAKTLLSMLVRASRMMDLSFVSPVEPEIVPVFLSADWVRSGTSVNSDGTVDMMSHPSSWAPEMDVTFWACLLETMGAAQVRNRCVTLP